MSHSAEQRDPEVFTLDHLFEGVPDLVVPTSVESPSTVDEPPAPDDPLGDATAALPGPS
ncbi:hypothetical protein [Aeromicrobium sp. IC_218]|uniref:hypothetical protein n=1 Tax=Aeromicrobium sp. IC_218 TaxID=2545468 RepID=UPI0013F46C3F|nr:hypothetical protein [Aeromicrobium sp. IC_218]